MGYEAGSSANTHTPLLYHQNHTDRTTGTTGAGGNHQDSIGHRYQGGRTLAQLHGQDHQNHRDHRGGGENHQHSIGTAGGGEPPAQQEHNNNNNNNNNNRVQGVRGDHTMGRGISTLCISRFPHIYGPPPTNSDHKR